MYNSYINFRAKKIISIILLLVSVWALSGCSKAKATVVSDNSEETCTVDVALEEAETTIEETTIDETTTMEELPTISTSETEPETTATETTTTTVAPVTTKKIVTAQTIAKKRQQTTTQKATEYPTEYIQKDISAFINEAGSTVTSRFKTPKGYSRVQYEEGSYAEYIRSLPLKLYGSKMYEYNGKLVENQSWCASVMVTEFHSRGWLQCADCVMKLIGDYLYKQGRYSDITFQLTGGTQYTFSKWSGGDYSKSKYSNFMSAVYCSANTYSFMSQAESVKMNIKDIFPGAYFIMKKDSVHKYGHAVFVVDVAKNAKGEVAFLLAQGSTPSQDMHIFTNPLHPNDPWFYSNEIGSNFAIPFWTFSTSNLYYYKPIGIQKGIVVEETVAPTTTIADITTTEATTTSANEETTTVVDEETTTLKEENTTVEEKTTINEEIMTTSEEITTIQETSE